MGGAQAANGMRVWHCAGQLPDGPLFHSVCQHLHWGQTAQESFSLELPALTGSRGDNSHKAHRTQIEKIMTFGS